MPDGMLRFDARDAALVATSLLILNPPPLPHEIGAAVVGRRATIDSLRQQLARWTDCMGSIMHIRVSDGSCCKSLLIDVSAEMNGESLNPEATRIAGGGYAVYGRAILLPYLVALELGVTED